MHQIVAFTGKRGHGKSTAAQALEFGHNYAHLNFADTLRQVAKLVYGYTDFELNDPVAKETVVTRWPSRSPREVMQYIGTDMFRTFIDDTWVTNWLNRTTAAIAKAGLGEPGDPIGVTCSDLRFLNEEAAVRKLGGIIIRVINRDKESNDVASQHSSETEMRLITADYTIINDGSIEELQAKVLNIVRGYAPVVIPGLVAITGDRGIGKTVAAQAFLGVQKVENQSFELYAPSSFKLSKLRDIKNLEEVKAMGGTIVEVQKGYAMATISIVDHVILNNSTKHDLQRQLVAIFTGKVN